MSETAIPETETPTDDVEVPTPADVARKAQEATPPEPDDGDEERKKEHVQKLRSENKALRDRLKAAEPVLKAAQEAEEAKKDEIQKALDRAEKAEQRAAHADRLELAIKHKVPLEDIGLIGSGSYEDMERNATRLGELHASTTKTAPPPSDRPVEGLRPGASPEPPQPADNSYPPDWGRPRPRAS